MKTRKTRFLLSVICGVILLSHIDVHAQSGTWISASDGNWTNTTNWKDGIIADGAGNTATFVTNLTADRTITLGTTTRTIGHLAFTNLNTSSRSWTISSSSGTQYLTFSADSLDGTSVVDIATLTSVTTDDFAGSNIHIRKTGPGTWSLGRANTKATGTLHVNEGVLSLGDVSSIANLTTTLGGGEVIDENVFPNADTSGMAAVYMNVVRENSSKEKFKYENLSMSLAMAASCEIPTLFPFSRDNLAHAVASTSAHETGHLLGLVSEAYLGG